MAPAPKRQLKASTGKEGQRSPQGGLRAKELEAWLVVHLSRFPRRKADAWTDYLHASREQQAAFERHLLDEEVDMLPFSVALALKGHERALKPDFLDRPPGRGRARFTSIVTLEAAARSLIESLGHDAHALIAGLCKPELTEARVFAIISTSYHYYLTKTPPSQPLEGSGELQTVQRSELRPKFADYLDQVEDGQHLVVIDRDIVCAHIEPGLLGDTPNALVKTRTEVRRRFGAFMKAILGGAVAEVIDGRVKGDGMPAAVFRPAPTTGSGRAGTWSFGIRIEGEEPQERVQRLLVLPDGTERLHAALDAVAILGNVEPAQLRVAAREHRHRLDAWPKDIRRLPRRQQQVALMMLRGLTPAEISQKVGLTVGTVRQATKRIYKRLGVHSRTELREKFGAI